MAAIVVRENKVAVMDSWLTSHRDHSGFMNLEDAKILRNELHEAVQELIDAEEEREEGHAN